MSAALDSVQPASRQTSRQRSPKAAEWREHAVDVRLTRRPRLDPHEAQHQVVAQYLGDGILAYFGYPQAHDDDAERALRAGLAAVDGVGALRERLGRPLAVRVGVHTGPVVVGEMGAGARRETLALGETTNVAARLEAAAAPDTVIASGTTLG